MRHLLPILALSVLLCFTGCPKETPLQQEPAQPTVEKPAPVKKAAPPVEPSTDEAKQVVELVGKLVGSVDKARERKNFELTPAGTVKAITLDTADLDESAFDLFAKQPDLEKLQITNFRDLNDSMIEQLAGLEKLKVLRASNSSLTDEGVKAIVRQFPKLVELDLASNTLITKDAMRDIAKLTDLETLTVRYCGFDDFSMLDISKMPKLKAIDVRANMEVSNSGLGYMAKLPSLTSVMHMSSAIDDFGLEALSAAKNMESLHMQDFSITNRAGESLAKFEKLNTLVVFRCTSFGSEGVLALKGLPLNRLTLRGLPSLDDTGMAVFRDLPTLKRLYLMELPSVSDAGMMNLVNLKELEVLDIWMIQELSDKSMETISKLGELRELSIRATKISDASVDLLLAMPKLQSLTIKDNPGITEAGKKKLRDSKKFRKLDLGE